VQWSDIHDGNAPVFHIADDGNEFDENFSSRWVDQLRSKTLLKGGGLYGLGSVGLVFMDKKEPYSAMPLLGISKALDESGMEVFWVKRASFAAR